jgi:hypothetical protein
MVLMKAWKKILRNVETTLKTQIIAYELFIPSMAFHGGNMHRTSTKEIIHNTLFTGLEI